ncbi:charged multivesicular body protein 7 [Biomphalaria glabrata]|uniref:Charged multivesicular body protein 7 n=1 Tax=Biomphalaria glabrata TaxID=6526 RepID=A0A9W3AE94_BIOGL|nr:charged multivesicular body protein 7-like [Biomphalaria glabrata]XP_055885623.1 charged multivesicular body protein 7-like [Biomphalaria glabrata]XP_055885629.1 charged multivesicular body protein 7-like [Biomphalaria glabrata]XP_055885635.1 charged multivesicular body protein 7-like [Biomphalaria glabrata]KAI8755255.1 charged multivesicular body protein 7-like [Biomphalaria glabrata]KAI8792775.1 charged multivesicular body protein 7 [Biomphalaria glabrata]
MAQKENKFPPELEDDQQAAVLYSPFREKSLNPTSWNRKLKFWENLLSGMALEQGLVTFDLDALPKMFERKGLTPKCLDTVIAELIKSGRVRSIENYSTSSSWLSWGFETLIKQPVVWGVSHLVGPSKPKSSIYVWPEVVKNLAEQLAQQHEKNVYAGLTTNLISMSDLRTSCFSMIPNDQDFEIILVQLEREKKIVVETKNKEKVVKFCKKEENSVEPITELELQVYQIQKTAKGLEKEISKCSTEIESLIDEAKRYIREGSKFKAKKSLKKKNGMLKLMEKKSSTLENLYGILEKIQDASTNEMVVKACESGLAALKSLNAETNLEKAEAVLDNLQEAVENQDDIAHTLGSLNLGEDSMEDLESELLELIKDDNQVVQHDSGKISSLDDLPDVPSHVPSRKKESTQSKHLPHKYLSSS